MLPVFKPTTGEEEARAVAEVLKSGWIGLGPKTAEFERAFGNYISAEFVVGVNSCTAALDLALHLLNIGPGDEVIVPTITFVSTAHVVLYRGARVVFADVEADTLGISFDDIVRKIRPKTKAVIVVHYAGRPVDVRGLRERIGADIAIIEDAAHAAGARYYGKSVGSEGNLTCFSFHAVKNLAMGDGGAIVTTNGAQYDRARRLRWLGIDRDTWTRTDSNRQYWWQYIVSEIGQKCHLNDIAAAIGLVQLEKLDRGNARRREIVAAYNEGLRGVVELPVQDDERFGSSWHIYCIRAEHRDDLAAHLNGRGISTGVHYYPVHLYPCYGEQPALAVAEEQARRMLTLPLFPGMTDGDVRGVIEGIRSFAAERGGILLGQ
ncbi:MAG TPA: DegT/DnrJ/EryC1/StrS aminotransferase family protein [Tepidisphaeraceae bacterium]|jgi:perosamine synthetase